MSIYSRKPLFPCVAIDSKRISRRLAHNEERNSLFSLYEVAERVSEIIAEKNDLLLRSDDYKLFKENLELQVSGQLVILKEKTAYVKRL